MKGLKPGGKKGYLYKQLIRKHRQNLKDEKGTVAHKWDVFKIYALNN